MSINKLQGLELLRFICALAVLIWHYQHFLFLGSTRAPDFVRSHQPLYSVLALFYERGFEGVSIFWCISGFIFFWKYRESIAGGAVRGREFFILRFSRLYPLHLLTLLAVAALQLLYHYQLHHGYFVYSYNDPRHFVLQLLFASNWGLQRGDSFNGPVWSISLEIIVYAAFYLILAHLSRSWLINLAIVALCIAARLLGLSAQILDCFLFFYVGGLSAIAHRWLYAGQLRRLAGATAWSVAILFPLVAVRFGLQERSSFPQIFLTCYVPVLLFCLCTEIPQRPLLNRCLGTLGNLTYSSYLLHFPLQLAVMLVLAACGSAVPFYDVRFLCVFIGGTLLISHLCYTHFEMPAQRLLRRRMGRLPA